jgi:hypothetical protein
VFHLALGFAVGAVSPIFPATSIAPAAEIAVCFSPDEDCSTFDNAESEILVGAYGLTTGVGIAEALARAKERGGDVQLIADRTTPCGRNSDIPMLTDAGTPIWIDDRARIAHQKAMVVDYKTGSGRPLRRVGAKHSL